MTTAEQYKKFEELDKLAAQGGGVERVEKQHANGHMTARERCSIKVRSMKLISLWFITVLISVWRRNIFLVTVSFVDMVKLMDV